MFLTSPYIDQALALKIPGHGGQGALSRFFANRGRDRPDCDHCYSIIGVWSGTKLVRKYEAPRMTGSTGDAKLRTVTVGIVLLAGGLAINYLLERYSVFKVWENSRYPISWADLFYPPLCVFLSLTGIALGVGGAIYRLPIRLLLRHAFKIVIPLTLGYILFAFAMQFVATGADRLGECPGLDRFEF